MRPIDGDALIRRVIARYKKMMGTDIGHGMGAIASMITAAPTLDLEPVRHGRWYVSEYEYLNCSVCGEAMYTGCDSTMEANVLKDHLKRFFPNCGAKMDGEAMSK